LAGTVSLIVVPALTLPALLTLTAYVITSALCAVYPLRLASVLPPRTTWLITLLTLSEPSTTVAAQFAASWFVLWLPVPAAGVPSPAVAVALGMTHPPSWLITTLLVSVPLAFAATFTL
jgi:hypothetical protein